MKIIFFGMGSIGQRHARILQNQYEHDLYAFRSNKNSPLDPSLEIKELFNWKDVERLSPDIAFITNPTSEHIQTAIACAKLNCKLFIEKPLDLDDRRLSELFEIIETKKLSTYVAFNLRFHPVIKTIKELCEAHQCLHMRVRCSSFLPSWRPGRDHKTVYSSIAKMGGGVLLDLSHELDYTHYLLGDYVGIGGTFGRVANITVDSEDYADLIIKTQNSHASIHLNYISQIKERVIDLDFENFSIRGDIINGQIYEYHLDSSKDCVKKFDKPIDLMYEKQLKYFFNNLNNWQMMNNVIQASKLFKQIIAFKNQQSNV